MTGLTANTARALQRFRNVSFPDTLRLYLRAFDLQLRRHRAHPDMAPALHTPRQNAMS